MKSDRYCRKFDEKTQHLHVWARPEVYFTEPKEKHPKHADWDEIFGRKVKKKVEED